MEKNKIRYILKNKLGYANISIVEKKGFDVLATNFSGKIEKIEIKETKNKDYYDKPRFDHKTIEQQKGFKDWDFVLLVCYLKDKTLFKLLQFTRQNIIKEGEIKHGN